MMWQAENPELARDFPAGTASKARQSRLHQAQGVFPVFVFSADTGTKRDGHGARGGRFFYVAVQINGLLFLVI